MPRSISTGKWDSHEVMGSLRCATDLSGNSVTTFYQQLSRVAFYLRITHSLRRNGKLKFFLQCHLSSAKKYDGCICFLFFS